MSKNYGILTIESFVVTGMQGSTGMERLKSWLKAENSLKTDKAANKLVEDKDSFESAIKLQEVYTKSQEELDQIEDKILKTTDPVEKQKLYEDKKGLEVEIMKAAVEVHRIDALMNMNSYEFSQDDLDTRGKLNTLLYEAVAQCVATCDYTLNWPEGTPEEEKTTVQKYIENEGRIEWVRGIAYKLLEEDTNIAPTDPEMGFIKSILDRAQKTQD